MKRYELRQIAANNGIKGIQRLKKFDLEKLLWEKGLVDEPRVQEPTKKTRKVPPDQELPAHQQHLRRIRTNPRRVEVTDSNTGETVVYPSLYKAANVLELNPRMLLYFNGKVSTDGKYRINILDAEV